MLLKVKNYPQVFKGYSGTENMNYESCDDSETQLQPNPTISEILTGFNHINILGIWIRLPCRKCSEINYNF